MSQAQGGYYLPAPSHWPLTGSVAFLFLLGGFANALVNQTDDGQLGSFIPMYIGLAILIFMLFGWFGTVIRESEAGQYNDQVDVSFRMGMMWFIFSEVMFFAAFFGALFYARNFSVPWLAGEGNNILTHTELWSNFKDVWPLIESPIHTNPESLGDVTKFSKPEHLVDPWHIPAINTLILLSSGVTVTFAHWALKKAQRPQLVLWLFATVVLGFVFVYLQIDEYSEAYGHGLKLTSGIYGSTFYMLTGFHGFHVTMGAIILSVIMFRSMKGHFTEKHHFAFEAAAWYWHFVDVVWLGLFIFVYVL
ncbi:MAG: cytochrome c oxidase subunit 3 [Gammaproteobacteria bacterium]